MLNHQNLEARVGIELNHRFRLLEKSQIFRIAQEQFGSTRQNFSLLATTFTDGFPDSQRTLNARKYKWNQTSSLFRFCPNVHKSPNNHFLDQIAENSHGAFILWGPTVTTIDADIIPQSTIW